MKNLEKLRNLIKEIIVNTNNAVSFEEMKEKPEVGKSLGVENDIKMLKEEREMLLKKLKKEQHA